MKKMCKRSLLATLALAVLSTTTATVPWSAKAADTAAPLIWCGLDYSKVKMIGTLDFRQPDMIFPGMLAEWNGLFVKEMLPKLESLAKSVQTDLNAVIPGNEAATAALIEREDGTANEKVKPSHLTEADLAQLVRGYKLKSNNGLGLVFIIDRLVKAQAKGCLYVVFFDASTRKVLYSERIVADAAGYGFRNFWFKPIKIAVEKLSKGYREAKNAQKSL